MQVFISHAKADETLARGLASALERAGFSVWNPESILPGDNWAMEIGRALETSELMIVLFSKRSRESATVTQEAQYALTSGNYRGRVVPVLVDSVTFAAGAEVPWVLLKMEPIYITSTSPDFNVIVNRIRTLAGAPTNAP